MGLAASQARLLMITGRMSDLELASMKITNERIRLAVQSGNISEAYVNSLNNSNLNKNTGVTNGRSEYSDVTYNSLTAMPNNVTDQRILTYNGKILVTQDMADKFETSGGNVNKFLSNYGVTAPESNTGTDSNNGTDETDTGNGTEPGTGDYTTSEEYKKMESDVNQAYTKWQSLPAGNQADINAEPSEDTVKAAQVNWQTASERVSSILDKLVTADDDKERADINRELSVAQRKEQTTKEYYDKLVEAQEKAAAAKDANSKKQAAKEDYDLKKMAFDLYKANAANTQNSGGTTNTGGTTNNGGTTGTTGTNGTTTTGNSTTSDANKAKYYTNLFNEMASGGYAIIGTDERNDTDWLESGLKNGSLGIEKYSSTAEGGKGGFVSIPHSADTYTIETDDSSDDSAAQAKYNAELDKLQAKDKMLELKLKNIDTEHQALQTEYDSVKKVIDKNIERSFKLFG